MYISRKAATKDPLSAAADLFRGSLIPAVAKKTAVPNGTTVFWQRVKDSNSKTMRYKHCIFNGYKIILTFSLTLLHKKFYFF